MSSLREVDPSVAEAIEKEILRQKEKIELIASENFVSPAVLEAQGSVLTNKYAEGYPGRRYYGGCEYVDIAESLAIERAKQVFGADHANVQSHAGAQANTAVYFAMLKPNDKVLGMRLSHGGHLTHGSPVNISGRYFSFCSYGVDKETGQLDYEELAVTAKKERPKMIIAGASAYPRIIDFKRIGDIAREVGAYFMVDMAHIAGLVACGLHPSPVPYADVVTTTTHKTLRGPRGGMILSSKEWAKEVDKAVFPGTQGGPLMHIIAAKAVALKEAMMPSFEEYQRQIIKNAKAMAESLMERRFDLVSNGTDNHLMLVDLRNKNITGKKAETALDLVGITVNKNAVPFDTQKPTITSGIRIGTPAVTTRGMKEPQMQEIAHLIADIVENPECAKTKENVQQKVKEIGEQFGLYAG